MPFAIARLPFLARIIVELLVKCLSLLGADDTDLVIFTTECSPSVDDRVDM